MQPATPNVPAHLRRFVVEQDYAQYNAVDQAVWRFVLLQTHSRLVETAHPAYRQGLTRTGISVERIPRISEMNERLGRFGWGAVCVDGFIPPRAFQEFQANGLLPIAADMRSREHLVYTPAPDIIHEAAGHAPILPDPVFAAYLRRIGELGRKAFTVPEEERVYRAIYTLSEQKEDPATTREMIERTEAELGLALACVQEVSEASRLSRLYWWTAEYGLVGRVDDYKLYGAGLLSSLWESHACHDSSVAKLPLDERCLDVAYDITRPQPQLFVTPDFEALHELLDRVERSLAANLGAEVGLARALGSRELCSVRFSSGAWLMGTLLEVGPTLNAPDWLSFGGQAALAWSGRLLPELPRWPEQVVLTGALASAGPLESAALATLRDPVSGRHRFHFTSGAVVEGRLLRELRHESGQRVGVELEQVRLTRPGRAPSELPRFVLLAAGTVVSAEAGAVDGAYHAESGYSRVRVPRPRVFPDRELSLISLYQRASDAHQLGSRVFVAEFPEVLRELDRSYPEEWLLRWNLLESLLKAGDTGSLGARLCRELEALELKFERRQPIASGLRYLAKLAA